MRTSLTGDRSSAPVVLSYGTGANPFSLATTIGDSRAYVGFTGATGLATGDHRLLGFAFSETYLANGIAAVPEPSTYALLALGLSFVGWTVWRRRR